MKKLTKAITLPLGLLTASTCYQGQVQGRYYDPFYDPFYNPIEAMHYEMQRIANQCERLQKFMAEESERESNNQKPREPEKKKTPPYIISQNDEYVIVDFFVGATPSKDITIEISDGILKAVIPTARGERVLRIEDDILTLSYQAVVQKENKERNHRFSYVSSTQGTFPEQLPARVDVHNVKAAYKEVEQKASDDKSNEPQSKEYVLTLTLPKKLAQKIAIATE